MAWLLQYEPPKFGLKLMDTLINTRCWKIPLSSLVLISHHYLDRSLFLFKFHYQLRVLTKILQIIISLLSFHTFSSHNNKKNPSSNQSLVKSVRSIFFFTSMYILFSYLLEKPAPFVVMTSICHLRLHPDYKIQNKFNNYGYIPQ